MRAWSLDRWTRSRTSHHPANSFSQELLYFRPEPKISFNKIQPFIYRRKKKKRDFYLSEKKKWRSGAKKYYRFSKPNQVCRLTLDRSRADSWPSSVLTSSMLVGGRGGPTTRGLVDRGGQMGSTSSSLGGWGVTGGRGVSSGDPSSSSSCS